MNPSVLHPDSSLKVCSVSFALSVSEMKNFASCHSYLQENDRVVVGKEYIVEANDSLQSIAMRFGTTAEEIVSLHVSTCHLDMCKSRESFHCPEMFEQFFSVAHQCRYGA
jgi:hypothetical protein